MGELSLAKIPEGRRQRYSPQQLKFIQTAIDHPDWPLQKIGKTAGYSNGSCQTWIYKLIGDEQIARTIERGRSSKLDKARQIKDLAGTATVANLQDNPDPQYALQAFAVSSKVVQDSPDPEPDDGIDETQWHLHLRKAIRLGLRLGQGKYSGARARKMMEELTGG